MTIFSPAPFFGLETLSLTKTYTQNFDAYVTDDVDPQASFTMPAVQSGDLCIIRQAGYGTLPIDYNICPLFPDFTDLRSPGVSTDGRNGWRWSYKILTGSETTLTALFDDGAGWGAGDAVICDWEVEIFRPNRVIQSVNLISQGSGVTSGTGTLFSLPVSTLTSPCIIFGEGHTIRESNISPTSDTAAQAWDLYAQHRSVSSNFRHHYMSKMYNTNPINHTVQYGNFENDTVTVVGTVVVT